MWRIKLNPYLALHRKMNSNLSFILHIRYLFPRTQCWKGCSFLYWIALALLLKIIGPYMWGFVRVSIIFHCCISVFYSQYHSTMIITACNRFSNKEVWVPQLCSFPGFFGDLASLEMNFRRGIFGLAKKKKKSHVDFDSDSVWISRLL